MNLIAILTSRLAGPIATAAALVLLILLGIQTGKLHAARSDLTKAGKQIAALNLDLGTCRANTSTLKRAVEAQNASLAALKSDADRRATMLADALHSARKAALSANRKADGLLALKPKGADVCARVMEVDKLVREGVR